MSQPFQYSLDGGVTWESAGPEGIMVTRGARLVVRYFGGAAHPAGAGEATAERLADECRMLNGVLTRFYKALEPYHFTSHDEATAKIAELVRASRAAHPSAVGGAEVKIERDRVWIVKGNQSFMLAYEPDAGDDPAEMEAYAAQLRAALSSITPDVKVAVGGAAELPETLGMLEVERRAPRELSGSEVSAWGRGWNDCVAALASRPGALAAKNTQQQQSGRDSALRAEPAANACAHCGRLPTDPDYCDWAECPAGGIESDARCRAQGGDTKPESNSLAATPATQQEKNNG